MKSEQLRARTEPRLGVLTLILAGVLSLLGGCTTSPTLRSPNVLTSPYDAARGDLVWAVAPLRNESGVGFVDTLGVADELAAAVENVRGLRALPVNRVIATMRALDMPAVLDDGDARRLAQKLGADAIIVGTITAYDPYDPPTLGLSVALYGDADAHAGRGAEIDPRVLTRLSTEYNDAARSRFQGRPLNVASDHLDARNHAVLLELKEFAEGRSDPESALNWRIYTASMELFTQFAAHHAVRGLLDNEWVRLSRVATADD